MNDETLQQRRHHFTKILALTGVAVVLGLVFNALFYGKRLGLSFPVYIILIFFSVLVLVRVFRTRLPKSSLIFLIPLFFFAVMVYVRADELLLFLDVMLCLYLLLQLSAILRRPNVTQYLVPDYIAPAFTLPFRYLRSYFVTMADLLTLRGVLREQRGFSQVIRGILMAIPVLVLFLFLFASADLVFSNLVTKIITIKIDVEIAYRAFIVFVVASAFLGAFQYFLHPTEHLARTKEFKQYRVGVLESSVLLGAMNALFLVFMIIQIAYLFGGEHTIVSQGFTYAEYARRGFFELIIVSIVSLLLLWTIEKYIVRKENSHVAAFQTLGTLLIVQVMVIMGSAFYRLLLYENAYGFTTMRLYSHILIVWIAVVFIFLLCKILYNVREHVFAFASFLSVFVFLALMNMFNLNAFIAQKNIDRFNATGKIDMYYLASLSDDAVGETMQLFATPNEELKNDFAHILYGKWRDFQVRSVNAPWQSWNLSRSAAQQELNVQSSLIEKNKDRSVDPLKYR